MKEVIERCYCDVCGSKEREAHTYKTLAYRTFDSQEGRELYNEPRFETVELDLCDECAAKITALHDIGVCCEKYEIRPVRESATLPLIHLTCTDAVKEVIKKYVEKDKKNQAIHELLELPHVMADHGQIAEIKQRWDDDVTGLREWNPEK